MNARGPLSQEGSQGRIRGPPLSIEARQLNLQEVPKEAEPLGRGISRSEWRQMPEAGFCVLGTQVFWGWKSRPILTSEGLEPGLKSQSSSCGTSPASRFFLQSQVPGAKPL